MRNEELTIDGDVKDGVISIPRVSTVNELVRNVDQINQRLEDRDKTSADMLSKMEALMKQMETLKNNYEQTREIEKETFSKLQNELNQAQQDLRLRISEAKTQVNTVAQLSDSASRYANQINQLLASAANNGKAMVDLRSHADEDVKSIEKTFNDYSEKGKKKIELDSVYTNTVDRFKKSESALATFEKDASSQLKVLMDGADAKIKEYCGRIENLFGGALSVGLGESYHVKCEEEKESHTKYTSQFNWALVGIGVIAAIAAIIHIVFAYRNDFLMNWGLFRFVSALTFPVLVPVLWFAFTSSRKANLAKRLAEEYAHKEVVSKAYVGLLKQVQNLGDNSQSKELLGKLLNNAVAVNERNAGELIKGYNRPDHPLLEVVERIDKIDKNGSIAKILSAIYDKK